MADYSVDCRGRMGGEPKRLFDHEIMGLNEE